MEALLIFTMAYLGNGILIALIALIVAGLWRLGRGRRFLVPAGVGRKIGAAVLLLLGAGCGLGLYAVNGPLSTLLSDYRRMRGEIGREAPNLAFHQVSDGAPLDLHQYRGKVVLVNLWATWCPPCRKEMPELNRLQAAYADRGLVVLNLSDEKPETLRKYFAENPMKTVAGYASTFGDYEVGGARPVSVVIDRDGVIREFFAGGQEYGYFEGKVRGLVG